jgi:hypothetical protein
VVHAPAHGRPKKHSKRNKRYLILCGGIVTEVQYFKYVKSQVRHYAIPNWDVQSGILLEGEGVDPLTLASHAVSEFKHDAKDAKAEQYDSFICVWAVTDVDDFGEKLQQAQDKVDTTSGKVKLIISNPCFEVWLIDHAKSCPESYQGTAMCQQLAKQLGLVNSAEGHKNKHLVIDRVQGHYSDALRNAQLHMRDDGQQSLRTHHPSVGKRINYAPWTDVPEVVVTLIAECKRASGHDLTAEL